MYHNIILNTLQNSPSTFSFYLKRFVFVPDLIQLFNQKDALFTNILHQSQKFSSFGVHLSARDALNIYFNKFYTV